MYFICNSLASLLTSKSLDNLLPEYHHMILNAILSKNLDFPNIVILEMNFLNLDVICCIYKNGLSDFDFRSTARPLNVLSSFYFRQDGFLFDLKE